MVCVANVTYAFVSDLQQLTIDASQRQRQAFRPGTLRNRRYHFSLYLLFCRHFQFRPLPASPSTLVLFVEFLLRSFRSVKSVLNALASVRFLHSFRFEPVTAFDDFHLKLMLRSLPLTHGEATLTPYVQSRGSCRIMVRGAVCFTR